MRAIAGMAAERGLRRCAALALVVLGTTLAACHGSSPSSPNPPALLGTWHVTKMQFVSSTNPDTAYDYIANGATITVAFTADFRYATTIQMPGHLNEVNTGTWAESGGVLTLTPTGSSASLHFAMASSGGTLTLVAADADYDFNNDGVAEPATLTMVLVRP
ncbi:MAG: lipocalin family protein [Gemmatimonadota bacterium]|nr:lipocalin family protein [Gemmatimonadota bacterium]